MNANLYDCHNEHFVMINLPMWSVWGRARAGEKEEEKQNFE